MLRRRLSRSAKSKLKKQEGRLSVKEKARWLFWVWFLRRHPDLAASLLIPGLVLTHYQRLFIRSLFNPRIQTCCLVWARGLGKDYTFAVASVLAASLFPGLRAGVVGRQFSDGQKLLELDIVPHILELSPFLAACIKKSHKGAFIHKGVSYWFIKFKNRSSIAALATGSGSSSGGKSDPKKSRRGFRFNLMLLNERKDLTQEGMKVYLRYADVEHPVFGSKIVHAGTVLFRDDRWTEDIEIFRRISKDNPKVFFSDISILDVSQNHPHFKLRVQELIEEVKRGEISPEEAAAEALNIPIEPSENLFIPHAIVKRMVKGQIVSSSNDLVVMGIDVGRVNESAITVGRPSKDGLDIIWTFGKSKIRHRDFARIVAEVATDRFPNTASIFLDQGGGGDDIAEWLINPEVLDGRTPLVINDSNRALLVYGGDIPEGRAIINMVHWGDAELSAALKDVLNLSRQGRLFLPPCDKLRDIDSELEMGMKEMRLLWVQLSSARRAVNRYQNWGIVMPTTRMGKDRLMSLVYCVAAWRQLGNAEAGWRNIEDYINHTITRRNDVPPSRRLREHDYLTDMVDIPWTRLLSS